MHARGPPSSCRVHRSAVQPRGAVGLPEEVRACSVSSAAPDMLVCEVISYSTPSMHSTGSPSSSVSHCDRSSSSAPFCARQGCISSVVDGSRYAMETASDADARLMVRLRECQQRASRHLRFLQLHDASRCPFRRQRRPSHHAGRRATRRWKECLGCAEKYERRHNQPKRDEGSTRGALWALKSSDMRG